MVIQLAVSFLSFLVLSFSYVADLSNVGNSVAFSKTDARQIMAINQLFRNDERLLLGRWPNLESNDNGYLKIDGYPSSKSITDNELPSVNWFGAAVHIKSKRWLIINRIVSAFSGKSLNFYEDTGCYGETCAGWGYFINSHINPLDQDGEWFYDEDTFKVYLFSTGLFMGWRASIVAAFGCTASKYFRLYP